MSALIEFDEVCKYYQMGDTTVKAADHITMKIEKGDICSTSSAADSPIEDGKKCKSRRRKQRIRHEVRIQRTERQKAPRKRSRGKDAGRAACQHRQRRRKQTP